MIHRWYETACDECGAGTDPMQTSDESRTLAAESGWRVAVRNPLPGRPRMDLCPACAAASREPMLTRSVTIPRLPEHEGNPFNLISVTLLWECPVCGGPRGEVEQVVSYDGSLRVHCDGWVNPCGHVDSYDSVRAEAGLASTHPGAER